MSQSPSASASPPGQAQPALPDVNDQTYPFDQVQAALDKSVWINTYSHPLARHEEVATLTPGNPSDFFGINGGYGLDLRSVLHRYESTVSPPARRGALPAIDETIGEAIGEFRARCLTTNHPPDWKPGAEPPPAIFDPWRPQYFSIVDGSLALGGDENSFGLYGHGMTLPQKASGLPETAICAVANTVSATGEIRDHSGTVVLCGTLTPELGFAGNISTRLPDPNGTLTPHAPIPPIRPDPRGRPADRAIYITMRGEKRDSSVRTEYGTSPGEGLVTLDTPAMMRSVTHRCSTHSGGGPRAEMLRGDILANLKATVTLDILAPPGTDEIPNFFLTRNVYSFVDHSGNTVGTVTAEVVLGKSFSISFPELPGQPGMRYGGVGPVLETDGIFAGMSGTVAVNSAIGIAPHALSMLNVLRLV